MYQYPLYRPPSEANSLIIQATIGCSHNKCSFCSMYKGKKFIIKSLEQIKKEIDFFRKEYEKVEKIFLADGDALIIPMVELKEILEYIRITFPECKRVTSYGSPKAILGKSIEELSELQKLGLAMIYMGVETGDEELLKEIHKGVSNKELIVAAKKVKGAKILLSATVIAGLGGIEKSSQHGINTGKLISKIAPDYLGVLSLMIEDGTELKSQIEQNKFKVLSDVEILEELKRLVENINSAQNIVFRCNHASNYIMLKGTIPMEKERLIKEITYCKNSSSLRCEQDRRL